MEGGRSRRQRLVLQLHEDLYMVHISQVCGESQVVHQAGAYPGFCSMKGLGVFLLPPGWDASPSQGYPQQ